MSETKFLLQPEFKYYHSLLSAYGENLIESFKQELLNISYDETSRALEFGTSATSVETVSFSDDGTGSVTMTLRSTSSMTDDGIGSVTIANATFTDNGNGNVYIS